MEETPGTQYHFKRKSLNQLSLCFKEIKLKLKFYSIKRELKQYLYLGCIISTSSISSDGNSNHSGSCPFACTTKGNTSKSVYFGFHPSFIQIFVRKTTI